MKTIVNIYAYLRVSTEDQTIENSKLLIYDYLNKNRYDISNLEWICEKKSGYKYGYKERLIGTEILPKIKKDDILIVSSLSRISRKLADVLKFIEDEVTPMGFTLIIANKNMIIDDNPLNKLVVSMLAMCAEFEINTLRERTKQGIKRYKAENNGKWGRPKGPGKKKLDPYKAEIKTLLEGGVKQCFIAKKYSVSPKTLCSYIKLHKLK